MPADLRGSGAQPETDESSRQEEAKGAKAFAAAASFASFAKFRRHDPMKQYGQARKGEKVNSLEGGTLDALSAIIPSDDHIPKGADAAGATRIGDRERGWHGPAFAWSSNLPLDLLSRPLARRQPKLRVISLSAPLDALGFGCPPAEGVLFLRPNRVSRANVTRLDPAAIYAANLGCCCGTPDAARVITGSLCLLLCSTCGRLILSDVKVAGSRGYWTR